MTDDNPVPAMFDHAARVYGEMAKRANMEDMPLSEGDEGGLTQNALVYKGHLTNLFQELGIPNPYYTAVMKALKAMNCVEQYRRGGGPAMSQWILLTEPTEEGFMAYTNHKTPNRPKGAIAAVEQRLRATERRLDRIEKWLMEEAERKTKEAV
jgi:hypothetical protein